jgi:DNA-binding CsgD family transcriptional regulator
LSEPRSFATAAERLAEKSRDLSATAAELSLRASGNVEQILNALGRLESASTTAGVIEAAPRELWATGVFDRILFSRVEGSVWSPETIHMGDPATRAAGADGWLARWSIQLVAPLVEAEVVRRRCAALVYDVPAEPRVHMPLARRAKTQEYVVAPLAIRETVIGLLHADAAVTGRPLDETDRTLLRLYADCVSQLLGRVDLRDRMVLQREVFEQRATSEPLPHDRLGPEPWPPRLRVITNSGRRAGHEVDPPAPNRFADLSGREHHVLSLLAYGLTNAELADQLEIAEATVKTHVKNILRKLGVPNRSAAIAMYLAAGARPEGERR